MPNAYTSEAMVASESARSCNGRTMRDMEDIAPWLWGALKNVSTLITRCFQVRGSLLTSFFEYVAPLIVQCFFAHVAPLTVKCFRVRGVPEYEYFRKQKNQRLNSPHRNEWSENEVHPREHTSEASMICASYRNPTMLSLYDEMRKLVK